MSKPVIGITCSLKEATSSSTASIGHAYVDSVQAAGGLPVLLPPWTQQADIPALLDVLNGVLLIGGSDIDPAVYGAAKHEKTKLLAKQRENFDLALARAAMGRGMPLMGICLGCQEVVVAAGGALIQHVPDVSAEIEHSGKPNPRHDVSVKEGSKLSHVIGCTSLNTNSSHHQAIDAPGPDMEAVAWAEDGIVEAAESTAHRFVLAIQWHPELLRRETQHRRLFEALVQAAMDGLSA